MSGLTKREQAALVGLADGTLGGAARARAEARVRTVPDADRLIERQRRVARALGGPAADAHALGRAKADAPAPDRRPALRFATAGALLAALLLIVVLVPGGERSTVTRAADLARLDQTDPAPASDGPVLRASVDGVAFPAWGGEFGWHETGMRRDVIDGRRSATVFYEHEGHKIAYTILSGPALPPPGDARVVRRDGLEISLYFDPGHGGHDVAVFERGGRTCVIAGHVLHRSTLIELAAWKGGGELRS
jgi:hypothetical protein